MIKRSKLWKYSKEELQAIYDTSSTGLEVLRKCQVNATSGNHRTMKKVVEYYGIDMSVFNNNHEVYMSKMLSLTHEKRRKDTAEKYSNMFTEHSTIDRKVVKRHIIEGNLLEYKCDKCFNTGKWFGARLVLQLEHKNGVNDDNRLENLCFLCPNCHSQTPTFSGKKNKKK